MDADERKHRIFVTAHANAQRRERERFLSAIPRTIGEYLAQQPYVVAPHAETWLARILPITGNGIGAAPQHRPTDYRFAAFVRPKEAIEFLAGFNVISDETDAFLSLWNPHCISFAEQTVIVPPLPLFTVDFAWIVDHLGALWAIANNFMAAFAPSLSVGFVLDSYCGYLEGHEMVFEVAQWGTLPT